MGKEQKSMDSLMSEDRKFPPPQSVKSNAHISSMEQYKQMWEQSIKDPDGFWLGQAKSLDWFKEPTKSLEYTWDTKARKIQHTWFADGEMNVSYNCLDRHLGTPIAKKAALVWQGEAEDDVKKLVPEGFSGRVPFFNIIIYCPILHIIVLTINHFTIIKHPFRGFKINELYKIQKHLDRRIIFQERVFIFSLQAASIYIVQYLN